MPDQKPSSAPKKKPTTKTVGKPLADIAKPNKGSLDTGSRPIIVSRKPVVDDPMVNKTANDSTNAPATQEDTRPMKDLLKAGRKELILSPTDQDAAQDESTKPAPGETINAGGDEAAAAQKTKSAESVNFEDLPVDESEEEEKSYVDALADDNTNDETDDSTNDDTEADKTKDLPSEVEVAQAEADDAPEITETKPAKKPAPKKVIAPVIAEVAESDATEPESTELTKTEDTKEAKKADKSKKPEEEKEQTQDEFTGDSVVQEPEGGLVDELAKQTADKKEQQAQDKKMDAQQEKIEELTAAKTYYVKTSKLSKRRARNAIIILLLLLIVVVVAANFALDAELFDAGIQPLTNIL